MFTDGTTLKEAKNGINCVLYADDGIIMGPEDELKKLNEFILKDFGVILSHKKKKDGSPATGEVGETLKYLGLT
jgi:hypothetical protein